MKNLKLITGILTVLALTSCGKKEKQEDSSKADFCRPTKEVFATWTSRSQDITYKMESCSHGEPCIVKFGSGSCDESRGDFIITTSFITHSDNGARFGDFEISNCANDTVIDTGRYDLGCENILSLTYDSDQSVEDFD
jgi:hypothetical protein